jgi:hypothetical protein
MATIICTTVTSVKHHHVIYHHCSQLGQNSVIDILVTTGRAVLGSNPDGGGVRFPTPETSPGAHPDVCTIGTGSFQGVKQLGCDVNHPPPSSTEVKKKVPPLYAFMAGCSRNFTFIATCANHDLNYTAVLHICEPLYSKYPFFLSFQNVNNRRNNTEDNERLLGCGQIVKSPRVLCCHSSKEC